MLCFFFFCTQLHSHKSFTLVGGTPLPLRVVKMLQWCFVALLFTCGPTVVSSSNAYAKFGRSSVYNNGVHGYFTFSSNRNDMNKTQVLARVYNLQKLVDGLTVQTGHVLDDCSSISSDVIEDMTSISKVAGELSLETTFGVLVSFDNLIGQSLVLYSSPDKKIFACSTITEGNRTELFVNIEEDKLTSGPVSGLLTVTAYGDQAAEVDVDLLGLKANSRVVISVHENSATSSCAPGETGPTLLNLGGPIAVQQFGKKEPHLVARFTDANVTGTELSNLIGRSVVFAVEGQGAVACSNVEPSWVWPRFYTYPQGPAKLETPYIKRAGSVWLPLLFAGWTISIIFLVALWFAVKHFCFPIPPSYQYLGQSVTMSQSSNLFRPALKPPRQKDRKKFNKKNEKKNEKKKNTPVENLLAAQQQEKKESKGYGSTANNPNNPNNLNPNNPNNLTKGKPSSPKPVSSTGSNITSTYLDGDCKEEEDIMQTHVNNPLMEVVAYDDHA